MKPKINRGSGFRGLLAYALEKGSGRVGGNMSGLNIEQLTKEFGITKKLRPDCKNPVWHCSLSLPKGERLSDEEWDKVSEDFVRSMGLDPTKHLYVVQRHSDTDYDHIHIISSRIGLDGTLWHGQNDVLKAIDVAQQLERTHNLVLTPGFDPEHKKDRKSLTAQEINMGLRTETKPPRLVAQDAIDFVLRDGGAMSAPQFIERLESVGVRAVPSVVSTGTMNGFSFEVEGVAFTGTKLGDGYKWAKLQLKGVEYVKDRDFESLANSKRLAGERAAAQRADVENVESVGRDSSANQEPGAIAGVGDRASDRSASSADTSAANVGAGESGAASIRSGELSPAVELGAAGPGADYQGGPEHGEQGVSTGQDHHGLVSGGAGHENGHGHLAGSAGESGQRSAERERGHDQERERAGPPGTESAAGYPAANRGPDAGGVAGGGVAGGGWASRFKLASAAKRRGAASAAAGQSARSDSAQGNPGRNRVAESDRQAARQIDPTWYLESQGFEVKRSGSGRNLSARVHGDEVYRCTQMDDGRWVTCDKYANGIGDNIALVAEMEPGIGFAESVYRLIGAPSVSRVTRPTPAPVQARQPPQMPACGPDDVEAGRRYLQGRGISLETIQQAERDGMLRYSAGGVLFVGSDEAGAVWNITRRSVDPSAEVQKRDLRGSDKRHPQTLRSNESDAVMIVEGGVDALAALDIARRQNKPKPAVIVSGGAGVRSWIETPWVQSILRRARKIIVAFDREKSPEIQAQTDADHSLQMQRLREVCDRAEVVSWMPPAGTKDLAELNAKQRQREAAAEKLAKDKEEEMAQALKPEHPPADELSIVPMEQSVNQNVPRQRI